MEGKRNSVNICRSDPSEPDKEFGLTEWYFHYKTYIRTDV